MNSHFDEKELFRNGPIDPAEIAQQLQAFSGDSNIGAHSMFIGQIRKDVVNDAHVSHLEYTANQIMAEKEIVQIEKELLQTFKIKSFHVAHSLGTVRVGEICLLVIVGSGHRSDCMSAIDWLVEAIKNRLPIFAKEMLSNDGYVWKVNSQKAAL